MNQEMKIPALGESITQVTIGKLLKKSGSQVNIDEEVIEIETDKLNQVLYAPAAGVLTFVVKEGDQAMVGDVVARIEVQTTATSPQPVRKQKEEWLQELKKPAEPPVEVKQQEPKTQEPKTQEKKTSLRSETRKKMSSIRRAIAQRLVAVTQETAMLTTFNEVDMSAVMQLREKYKDDFQKKYGVKLGFMSFFVKASTDALQAFPVVNSYLEGEDIVLRNYFDIAVAVSTDKGLFVPVLRGCDALSYADIEKNIEDLAKRAKSGQLVVDELQGGGFTITNGGTFGSMLSTPILNPPQCAILGMHRIIKRPVVVNDAIVIRPMMYLALSYDHRVLDGKEAVSFLVHIKNMLEDPERMQLHV